MEMVSRPLQKVSHWTRFLIRLAGFDDGSPDGNDPLVLARQMASRGITLVSFPDTSRSIMHTPESYHDSTVLRCLRAGPEWVLCAPFLYDIERG